MIKPNQTRGSNVNVLDEAKLEQVIGGRGHGGGHRKNYDKNRRYNDCYNYDGGYEGKGSCEDSYENYDCYSESYDHCDRKYS